MMLEPLKKLLDSVEWKIDTTESDRFAEMLAFQKAIAMDTVSDRGDRQRGE